MDLPELGEILQRLGCPPEKSTEMAAQLDKRARQLAAQRNQSYESALEGLLSMMRQGWAAKEKGF